MKTDFLKVVNCHHDWKYTRVLSDGLLSVQVAEYKCSKCGITKTEVS